jgi:predicted anti-sigma-YlaC factor YlaD
VSAICGILRGSFEDYLADALPAPQRRILREHLAACPECRGLAVEKDPTFVFARPVRDEVTPEETTRVLSAVMTGVALMETEKRIRRTRRRLAGGTAAAAAVVALVLLLPGVRHGAGTAAPPAGTASLPGQPLAPSPVSSDAALSAAALPAESSAPAGDATVYDWNPGAGREEPRVVWIVDRGLDI